MKRRIKIGMVILLALLVMVGTGEAGGGAAAGEMGNDAAVTGMIGALPATDGPGGRHDLGAAADKAQNADFSHAANCKFLRDNGVEQEQIEQLDADTIKSIVMQSHANNFTPVQIQQMVKGQISFPSQLAASAEVRLPGFKVTLNGEVINNAYSQYPLIVHNDITYFPMTYHGCRFLGVETDWSSASVLKIETTGVTAAYNPYTAAAKNGDRYNAHIPYFSVTVNGETINNREEEYPLLHWRDITYFPLTWRFAVEEFGWEYSFDETAGLIINSDNIKLEQYKISSERSRQNPDGNENALNANVTIAGNYVYYAGTEGRIMQSPLTDPARSKMVYQLPGWTYGTSYVFPKLYAEDGAAMLFYHQGGATMGTDYLIRLNPDGSAVELNNSRSIYKTFGDKTFSFWGGPAPSWNNLWLKTGDGESRQLGDPDYLYGWAWTKGENGQGGGPVNKMYLRGDDLYILAFNRIEGEAAAEQGTTPPTNSIYRVNLKTNATTRLVERQVLDFQLDGDHLYYPSGAAAVNHLQHDSIYRYSLIDGKEELLGKVTQAPSAVYNFAVLNGRVYWQDLDSLALYDINGVDLNPGAINNENCLSFAGDDDEYLVCTFEETPASQYRIMIFDKNGEVAFKTSDRAYADNITIEGQDLYFYNITTGTVCRAVLP